MSMLRPDDALRTLAEGGVISAEREASLSERGSTRVRHEAMVAVRASTEFLAALARLVDEIEARATAEEEQERALRQDPRYANAPEVTGVFVRQMWESNDYLTEVGREDFTVPLPYLAENREALEGRHLDFSDLDWLAFDLGLATAHGGPFDVEVEESLSAWMEATAEVS